MSLSFLVYFSLFYFSFGPFNMFLSFNLLLNVGSQVFAAATVWELREEGNVFMRKTQKNGNGLREGEYDSCFEEKQHYYLKIRKNKKNI